MSGFVCVAHLDGSPVDRPLLERLTDGLADRGPDDRQVRVDGHVGLGHTLLRTTDEAVAERQPCSLDGRVWLAADARVDGRRDLIERLRDAGEACPRRAPDPELILHAYRAWGEGCLAHLIGDFAFVLWDAPRRRLFCARDHFGVKPFYYATVANRLVLSNTLRCVRSHPAVSAALDDLAIADFLLFEFTLDPETTAFTDVKRLPPAHTLTWADGSPRRSRYWTLPRDGRIRYRRADDYVDRFTELFRTAVADRIRTDRVAVFMSGGLDSTAVAAIAREVAPAAAGRSAVEAHTVVYDRLVPDDERHYAGLAAQALDLPIQYLAADGYALYERWDAPPLPTPEPDNSPLAVIDIDQFRRIAADRRVALCGYGGDPALRTSRPREAIGAMGVLGVLGYLGAEAAHGRLRGLGSLRAAARRWWPRRTDDEASPFPPWIAPALAHRLDLRTRWRDVDRRPDPAHPFRPEAHASLGSPFWASCLERCDPGATGVPVEMRNPFFDVRLIDYLLAIPPLPWFVDKTLLRRAMGGRLPEAVCRRPKTPMRVDPVVALLRTPGARWVDDVRLPPALDRWVDRTAVPRVAGEGAGDAATSDLNPLGLHLWLRYSGLDR